MISFRDFTLIQLVFPPLILLALLATWQIIAFIFTFILVHKQKHEFFAFHYQIISQIPNQFPAGQYSYPFSFMLPQNLPPSFVYFWNEEGHNCYSIIDYRVKAVLTDHQKKKLLPRN